MRDKKEFQKQILTFAGIIVVFFVIVLVAISSMRKNNQSQSNMANSHDSKQGSPEYVQSIDDALKEITVNTSTPRKASVELGNTALADELPEIEKYPLTVQGMGQVNIEIFATSEKSGSNKDGWLNEMAEQFNSAGNTLANGSTVSVSIRPIASGLGSDYIVSKKYLPDAYTPSNSLFGELTIAQGGELTTQTDRLVGNVAGMLLSKDKATEIKNTYKEVTVKTVTQATADNKIIMGYTNPLSSATGLNFLMSTLSAYDSNNVSSDTAKNGFTAFQKNVPYVAYTTLQMRESAKSGSLTGMIMEYQSYYNDADLSKDYEFIPFGERHNNPLYAVGTLSADKQAALDLFTTFCASEKSQALATEYGFNGLESYQGDNSNYTGADIIQAQKLWKSNKDSGKEIIAVFVADCSGSMDGDPINQLRQSLINGSKYINETNSVGLVSYSTDVTIDLPIAKFDLNQRAYFQGAVEDLSANGGTASYNAVIVGTNMLIEAKKNNPNAKIMLFLLSDGQANQGFTLDSVTELLKKEQIPIYTISYGSEADKDSMAALSNINEAATINADSDDIIYKIKSLFNAQM